MSSPSSLDPESFQKLLADAFVVQESDLETRGAVRVGSSEARHRNRRRSNKKRSADLPGGKRKRSPFCGTPCNSHTRRSAEPVER